MDISSKLFFTWIIGMIIITVFWLAEIWAGGNDDMVMYWNITKIWCGIGIIGLLYMIWAPKKRLD